MYSRRSCCVRLALVFTIVSSVLLRDSIVEAAPCGKAKESNKGHTSVPLVDLCIEKFVLQNNYIASLGAFEFQDYTELLSVDLRGNLLTSDRIHPDAFCGAPLLTLILMNNNLTRLPDVMCLKDQIADLRLGDQKVPLKRLEYGDINLYSQLTLLRLNINAMEYVYNNAFCGTKLETINFSTNLLTEVPNLTCIGSTLATIHLNNNRICSLGATDFCNLTKLNYLDLSNNCLVDIVPVMELATSPVKILWITQNQIHDVGDLFDNFDALSDLRLSQNQLSCFMIVCGNILV